MAKKVAKRFVSVLLVFVMAVAVLALSGCGSDDEDDDYDDALETDPPYVDVVDPFEDENGDRYGGVVRFAWAAGPIRPNVILRRCGPGGIVRDLHWGRLYSIAYDGSYVPSLATGHSASDCGLIYTVYLRQGVLWHDGHPFTSADVVFFHEYAPLAREASVDVFTPAPAYTVRAIDDYTVEFTLEVPNPFFAWQHQLVEYMVLPKHIWEDIDPSQWDYITDLDILGVGIGPFRLVELVMDEFARFERFDDFWGGRPYLDGFVYQFLPDLTSRMIAFETGQLDKFIGITRAFYESNRDNPNFEFEFKPSGNMQLILINHNDPRIADLAVRQALSYVMDRDSMRIAIEIITAPMLSSFTSSDIFQNPAAADATAFLYDVELANQILDDAGWLPGADGIRERDGMRLEFEILTTDGAPQFIAAGVVAAHSATQAGISLTTRIVDSAQWTERVFDTANFDMAFNGMILGPTPFGYRNFYTIGTHSTFVSDEVYDLFAQVDQLTDMNEIARVMDEIQYIVTRERAAIWLWENVQGISWTNNLNVSYAGISGLYERWNHVGRLFFER